MANIIIAFPKPEDGKGIRSLLMRNGIEVHAVCTSGAQAIRIAGELGTGILICGYRLTDMIYADVAKNLPKGFELLILGSQARLVECAGRGYMFLSMPIKVHDLVNTIGMLQMNVTRYKKKLRQTPKKRDPKELELIGNAKALVMERNHMTEEEAHRYIQKTSMDNGTSMVETAEMILKLMII